MRTRRAQLRCSRFETLESRLLLTGATTVAAIVSQPVAEKEIRFGPKEADDNDVAIMSVSASICSDPSTCGGQVPSGQSRLSLLVVDRCRLSDSRWAKKE